MKPERDGRVRCSAWLGRAVIQAPLKSVEKTNEPLLGGLPVFEERRLQILKSVKLLVALGLVIGQHGAESLPLPVWKDVTEAIHCGDEYRNTLGVENLAPGLGGKLGSLVGNYRHELIPTFGDATLLVATGSENMGQVSSDKTAANLKYAYQQLKPLLWLYAFMAGWTAYEIRDDVRHWWRRRKRPNDPSSATGRQPRNDEGEK